MAEDCGREVHYYAHIGRSTPGATIINQPDSSIFFFFFFIISASPTGMWDGEILGRLALPIHAPRPDQVEVPGGYEPRESGGGGGCVGGGERMFWSFMVIWCVLDLGKLLDHGGLDWCGWGLVPGKERRASFFQRTA